MYYRIFAARARPCTAHTRFFGFLNTQNGPLRAPRTAHRSFADLSVEINYVYVEKTGR